MSLGGVEPNIAWSGQKTNSISLRSANCQCRDLVPLKLDASGCPKLPVRAGYF